VRVLLLLVAVAFVAGALFYARMLWRRVRRSQARMDALESELSTLRAEAQRLAEEAAVLSALLAEKGVADEEDFAEAHRRYAGTTTAPAAESPAESDGEKDTLH
jgi:Flp pilus assembly protein TadB